MAVGLRSRNDENEVDRYRKLKFEGERVINHLEYFLFFFSLSLNKVLLMFGHYL